MPTVPALPANGPDYLKNMTQLNSELAANGTALPPNWATMTPEQKQDFLNQTIQGGQQSESIGQKVVDFAEGQKDQIQDMQMEGVPQPMPAAASSRVFNLKRFSQLGPTNIAPPMTQMPQMSQQPASPQPQGTAPQGGCPEKFADAGELMHCLKSFGDPNEAIKFLSEKYTNSNQMVSDPNSGDQSRMGEALGVVKDTLNDFFSTDDPSLQMKAAQTVFDTILPDSAKVVSQDQPGNVQIPQEQAVLSMVKSTNEVIKKLAQKYVSKKPRQPFNLKKEAQHQSVHNVIYFGPEQNKVDTFTGQLINDWHLVERNKGFGLRVDDVLDIDFEPLWRNTVMDKYYRPYRDRDGSWKGGYIAARFEEDKNIPPLNNYQLKPGEKRKPVLPEYGNIGSRLEAERNKMNKKRGYAPAEESKPFNWSKASAEDKLMKTASIQQPAREPFNLAKSVKTAQIQPLQPLPEMKLPGDTPNRSLTKNPVCQFCGGNIAKTEAGGPTNVCENCKATMTNPGMVEQQAPAPGVPQQQVAPSQRLSSADGIFFDGRKFIVYANSARVEFDSYDDAENFSKQPSVEATNPVMPPETDNGLNPRKREMYDVADKLGIDG
jgi:hypothetical protein